jgi:hypothetical protein
MNKKNEFWRKITSINRQNEEKLWVLVTDNE